TIFPLRLSPLDPMPIAPTIDWLRLGLGCPALAAVAVLVWRMRRQWPAFVVASVAYALLLAPVVGLTPSGLQATADRYMYLPGVVVSVLVGIAVGGAWRDARVAVSPPFVALAGLAIALGVL